MAVASASERELDANVCAHDLILGECETLPVDKSDVLETSVAEVNHKAPAIASESWTPLLLIALSSFGFSLQALFLRKLTLASVPTFQVLVVRGCCQTLGCVCTLFCKGRAVSSWLGESCLEVRLLSLRGVIGFGGISLGFLAVAHLPLSESQVLAQTVPVFAAIYAWICLGERWHLSEFIASLCAICGVLLIVRPSFLFGPPLATNEAAGNESDAGAHRTRMLGVTFAMLSATSAGGAYVMVRLLGTRVKVDWAIVLLYQALGQILLCPLGMLAAAQKVVPVVGKQFVWLLSVGFLGFWSQAAMTWGMQREKSATAAIVRQGLSPVFSILWQVLFLPADALHWTTFAGFGCILSGLILIVFFKQAVQSTATSGKTGTQESTLELSQPTTKGKTYTKVSQSETVNSHVSRALNNEVAEAIVIGAKSLGDLSGHTHTSAEEAKVP